MTRVSRVVCRTALLLVVPGLLGGCVHEQQAADKAPSARTATVTASSTGHPTPSPAAASPGARSAGPSTAGTPSSVSPQTSTTPAPASSRAPANPVPPNQAPAPASVPAAARAVPSRGGVVLDPTGRGPLSGHTIVVDPGHNGNQLPRVINRQVPAGNGRTKPCNTSGTQDVAGRPEHEFTWGVGQALAADLRSRGARVVLTRPHDHGTGPCVDERAAIGNAAGADLVLSIHADGNMSRAARGFHIIVSDTMVGGAATEGSSMQLARRAVATLSRGTSLGPSTYIGGGTGIAPRDDIAGLNLSRVPAIMLEAGNMRQSQDAAILHDPAQRVAIARALADAAQASIH